MCFGTSSGNLTQLCHFGPIIAVFLISYITIDGLYCLLQWWPPVDFLSKLHFCVYCTWPFLILYNYFNSVFLGPGFVPKNWKPENKEDEKYLQFCKICNAFKAPRSHHCRKCNRCVLKMDHHCPWINSCCGHSNHASFVYFLFFAPLGCMHAMLILGPAIYRAIFRNYNIYYNLNVPMVHLNFLGLVVSMFALGLALGVTIAVGILFVIQFNSIRRNQSGIESWIIKKAIHRRKYTKTDDFVYPYDLGWKENFRQVFNWSGNLRPIGDGVRWNVRSDCDQFTLTREQKAQKDEKREHAVKYVAINEYNGKCCPCNMGCKVCCCIPWNDDPRIKLNQNDVVLVTRWQKHWLYGENLTEVAEIKAKNAKINEKENKGWFPYKCVRLHDDEKAKYKLTEDDNGDNSKKEN